MQTSIRKISLNINGVNISVNVESRDTLLDTLRDKLGLTGAKKGCDEAVCGACTVILNGHAICSCMMFAVEAENCKITTIEGLANDELDELQREFIENDSLQCGYCTSGQILSAKAFLDNFDSSSQIIDELTIKDALSGNICRCGAYNNIVKAIQQVSMKRGLR